MNKSVILARSNIRKARGQTVAVAVLVLLSSIMMNLWLMLSIDYKKNFDRCHERLNDGHINFYAYVVGDDFKSYASETLGARSDITEFTVSDALCAPFSFRYNGGELSQLGVLLEKENALSRNVGKIEITEDSGYKSGIYIPMLYSTVNNYSVGDSIEITLFSEEREYTVCGFFNSAMAGSHNCGMMAMLLTEDKFDELSEDGGAVGSAYISARVNDVSECERIYNELKETLTKEFPDAVISGNDYSLVTTSRYISQTICAGVLSAMAFLVLIIGVVVIVSNIANYIREDMRNLGALKAVGYTSGQLVSALTAQFSAIAAAAAVVGIAVSYCVFPGINELMIAQTGIPYEVRVRPIPVLFTLIFITGVVAAAVFFSAKGIKKIDPITAMRQGIATHNFKKNRVRLEITSLSLNAALAMKTMLGDVKRNITVCAAILVISPVLVFSVTAASNTIADRTTLINMIVGELADAAINVNPNRENELISELRNDSRVEKFYLYTSNNQELHHLGGSTLYAHVTDDCSKMNNRSMIIEGRYPIYGNELAVGAKYAKDNGIRVGDELTLTVGNTEGKYIVSGFTQCSNYLGKDCIMTREGFEKLAPLPNMTYYIDLEEGTDIDGFCAEQSERFGVDMNEVYSFPEVIESTSKVYVLLMTFLVIAAVIISCIVIVFVMYLLVRTLLNSKKRDYGVLKALGFTTRQLVVQTALSFMPSVIVSSAAGIAGGIVIINPLIAVFLSGIGIVKGPFAVPVGLNIIAGAVLVLFAFGAACLMSLRVRRIAPIELLSGE